MAETDDLDAAVECIESLFGHSPKNKGRTLATEEYREIPLRELDGTGPVSDNLDNPPYTFFVRHPSRDPRGRLEKIRGVVQLVCASGHVFIHNPVTEQNPFAKWDAVYPEHITAIRFSTHKTSNVLIVESYDAKKQTLNGRMIYIPT